MEEARGDAGLRRGAALALGAVLVAGCGDDEADSVACTGKQLSKPEYETCFKRYIAEIQEKGSGSEDRGDDLQAQADDLDRGLSLMHELARDLEGLEPPAEIANANRDFAAGVHRTATDMEPVVAYMRQGDEARANQALDAFPSEPAREKIVSARNEFAAKGYELDDVSKLPVP